MTDDIKTDAATPKQKLANNVALAMWKATTQAGSDEKFENSDARKEAWKAAKPEMKKAARKLLKNLDVAGYTVVLNV
jgi:hypothetical protein